MCIFSDGQNFHAFSRSKILDTSEYNQFNRCKNLIDVALTKSAHNVFSHLDRYQIENSMPRIAEVRIYGEIYGGFYPTSNNHRPKKGQTPVQQEVMYSPNISFRTFKIKVKYQDRSTKWLTKELTAQICSANDLHIAPILFRGTFENCLAFSILNLKSRSIIPNLEGQPHLTWIDNIREGHVIEPNEHTYSIKGELIMFKHKNEEFKENCNGEKRNPIDENSKKVDREFIAPHIKIILDEASGMMTKARLANVISKDIIHDNWRDYLGPMQLDIVKDVLEWYNAQVEDVGGHDLSEKELKLLKKLVSQQIVFPNLEKLFQEIYSNVAM